MLKSWCQEGVKNHAVLRGGEPVQTAREDHGGSRGRAPGPRSLMGLGHRMQG